MRRIDAPRAFAIVYANGKLEAHADQLPDETPVRIVRESDWRELTRFARVAESYILEGEFAPRVTYRRRALAALDALNAKPKERKT